jgi:hypothetical protein
MEFRQAVETDVPELLNLINTQAIQDKDKIVIVPEKFRQASLEKAIKAGRIFVACQLVKKDEFKSSSTSQSSRSTSQIVGYKKLFVLHDATEKAETLKDELCCAGAEQIHSGFVNAQNAFNTQNLQVPKNLFDFCIYNGADFTLKSHRGQGINNKLTNAALKSIKPELEKAIGRDKTLQYLTVVYGVTEANAGEKPGIAPDRMIPISKSVRTFVQDLKKDLAQQSLMHFRFNAVMPTFDPTATECRPMQDGVKGFGCTLSLDLNEHKENHA